MRLPTLVLLLARLGRLNEAAIQDVCRRHATNAADLRLLALLQHKAGDGPVSPTEISGWIVQTSGGITATIGRLEAHGYVSRVPDPADGRGRLVELTDAGAAFHRAVFDDLVARFELVLGAVDVDAALAAVWTLVDAFERSADAASSTSWIMQSQEQQP